MEKVLFWIFSIPPSKMVSFLLSFQPTTLIDGSSFGLSYHGGKIMTDPVNVSLLWFGAGWEESGREAIRNAITSLNPSRYLGVDSDVPTLGDWWNVVRQYGDGSNAPVTDTLDIGAECYYTGPQLNVTQAKVINVTRSVFNRTLLDAFGGNLNCTRPFEANESNLYYTLFSHSVKFLSGEEQMKLMYSCSGSAQLEVFAEVNVTVAWAREPQQDDDQCSMFFRGTYYLGTPNGDEKIDSLVGYVLAKITVDVTNQDGKGWIGSDGSGLTVSSYCASVIQQGKNGPPLFMDKKKNVSFNVVGLNGYRYIVQYLWDQNIRNCALKLSEACNSNAIVLEEPKGYLRAGIVVNHTDGLQPYPPNQRCQWRINYPSAKFISFSINYLSLGLNSGDYLQICQSDSSPLHCSTIQSNDVNPNKKFVVMSSSGSVQFSSGDQVSFQSRGWELVYSAGLCNGMVDVYDHRGIIGYTSSDGSPYIEGLSCQWVLHGKPGTLVSINFTHINISRNLDFVAVFDSKKQEIANFSGYYSKSDLPGLNLAGEVRIAFATQTDKGKGWSANFYIASPDKRNRKELLVFAVLAAVAVGISFALVALALHGRKRGYMNRTEADEGLMLVRLEAERAENQIGEGPSAVIYRAISADGRFIAVKCRRDMASQMDLEEEILLKSSSHPNIISLLGHAQDGIGRRYLVFELMSRGNLRQNLRERGEMLDWEKRFAIALQICSSIQMLHMYSTPPIYHGNITSENILLDESFHPKLAGFGAANYCCSSNRTNTHDLSEMAEDIRSFGLVLVELLTGQHLEDRRAYRLPRSLGEINLLLSAQEGLDHRLEVPNGQSRILALAKFGEIAKWCISSSCRVEGGESNLQIGDVISGLKQVKQLFCSAEG